MLILSVAGIEMLSGGMLLGYGALGGFIMALILSSRRRLLRYVVGALVYWLAVALIYNILLKWLMLSEWHSYVTAMGISWLPLFAWVVYRAMRYDNVSQAMQQQNELAAARYVEHTPIYGDDFQPRFE